MEEEAKEGRGRYAWGLWLKIWKKWELQKNGIGYKGMGRNFLAEFGPPRTVMPEKKRDIIYDFTMQNF